MATNARGRSGSSYFGGHSTQSSWGSASKTKECGSSMGTASGYKSCQTTFANKVQSFKMLMSQTTGSAKCGRPTPTTLNSFANWINKGAVVQTCTKAQVSRWAKSKNKSFNTRDASPTTCKNVLSAKFGKSTIKAVCCTKTGSFMVVTAPTCKGKKFCFPK